jgi:hypothetical protein
VELFAGLEDELELDEEPELVEEVEADDAPELDEELEPAGVEGTGGLPRSSRALSRRSSRSLLEAGALSPLLEAGVEG